ncbi:MAG: magnesium transporter [bacterium]
MTNGVVGADIAELIHARDWAMLRRALADVPAPEIADRLTELDKPDRVLLFRALARPQAAAAFAHLEPQWRRTLLEDLTDDETRELLAGLPPDDRTQLLEELPGQVTQRLLNLLSPEDLKEARWLLGYPAESVGRLMTPDYVAVRPEWTIEQALAHIRAKGKDSETINVVYVVDQEWRLLDDIELRRLILAAPGTRVEEIMDHAFVTVPAHADREEAVLLMLRYDLIALPVVDSDGVLLGIVTVDDILDVAEEEATEDFHRVGSVAPLRTSLKEATVGYLYRRRILWLLALVVVNIFSGAGIAAFSDTIAASVALVFFLPLLIGSGGNAGAQSATLMVRALATGDVGLRDWLRMLGKELAVSGALGITMALAASLIGIVRAPEVTLVVASTMFVIVIVGSLMGMSMPFLLTRLGFDPATASAPLITSLADIVGVIIYFSIAAWYLGG